MGYSPWGHRESDTSEPVYTYIDTTIYKIKDLLLCSTRNSARYSVMTYVGKESKKEYVCVCIHFSEFSSVAQSCPTLCDPMNHSTPGLPVHHQLPEFTQTHVHQSVMPSNRHILCCPRLLLPSIFPSIRVFSSESALRIRWPKDWSFSFSISPSNEHPGLISFRMDWLDLLAVPRDSQESPPTPQCKITNSLVLSFLLQHHSSKASIL